MMVKSSYPRNMLRFLMVIVMTTWLTPRDVDGFYISWYPDYAPAKTALSQKPSEYYQPYNPYKVKPRKPSNSFYAGSIMVEDNELCTKFQCNYQKPCCSGECVNVFGMNMCIVVSRNYGYGRR